VAATARAAIAKAAATNTMGCRERVIVFMR
jgi:hypothetical protein